MSHSDYSRPRKLDFGFYPLDAHYDNGGCDDDQKPLPVVSQWERARIAERKQRMMQRGGNNPLVHEEVPTYAQAGVEVGTGCMNHGCMCKDCHGDCYCDKRGKLAMPARIVEKAEDSSDAMWTWIALIGLAWFVTRKLRR